MIRRRLSISEALKMLQELPSGSESEDANSDSDTEEYVPNPLEQSLSDSDDMLDVREYK